MNHKQYIHAWIRSFTNLGLVFDMTCGNGHDTLFLAEQAEEVIAVDIQAQAIIEAKNRTKMHHNIRFLNQSHDTMNYEDYPAIDGAIYNLGYLPGSDKSITTNHESTLTSLKSITPHLNRFLVVSCYLKHPGGMAEYLAVKDYLESLNADIEVFRYETPLSPVTFMIDFTK